MKIMVLGGTGQLGQDIGRVAEGADVQAVLLSHEEADVTNPENLSKAFAAHRPDIVVNTAAMHHVENCEDEIEKAFLVNGIGALNVARASAESGSKVVHISTDYVFDGAKKAPYLETDTPLPLNVYGNTKLSGEYFVQATTPRHFVLRVSGLFGIHPCRAKQGRNFVTTMLKLASERDELKVVTDEIVTPTHTLDIARQIMAIADSDAFGLYHVTSEGACSWYDFAKRIFEIKNVSVTLNTATSADFPSKVARPTYSVLENAGLKAQGLNVMPKWENALEEFLSELP